MSVRKFWLAVLTLLVVGCSSSNNVSFPIGSGGGPAASPGPSPSPSPSSSVVTTAGVTVNFNLEPQLRQVSVLVERFRFTFRNAAGAIVLGPFEQPRTTTVSFDVPVGATELQIDYLRGNTVLGLSRIPLDLSSGSVTISDPDYVDIETLQSLNVTPGNLTLAQGARQALQASGVFSDSQSYDLTGVVGWSTGSSSVARVNRQGQVVANNQGNTTITASVSGRSAQAAITVGPARLVDILVVPGNSTLPVGVTQSYLAIAQYSDGTSQPVSSSVSWAFTKPLARVDSEGRATGLVSGTCQLVARMGSLSGEANVTVVGAQVRSLRIQPQDPVVPLLGNLQLQAIATFTDGSTRDVAGLATWSSSVPSLCAVDSQGKAYGLVEGTATITATVGTQTAAVNARVFPDPNPSPSPRGPARRIDTNISFYPFGVTAADVDKDGKLDAVVCAYTDVDPSSETVDGDGVVILYGDGTGGFARQQTLPLKAGTNPSLAAIGDFNKDGFPDLATTGCDPDTGEGAVIVILQTALGTFATPAYVSVSSDPAVILTRDFDRDGNLDLAYSNFSFDSVDVLFGSGTGTFSAPLSLPVDSFPEGLTSADYNQDGLPDLATSNLVATVSVLINRGGRAFQAAVHYEGAEPANLGSNSFTPSGRPDLVTANFESTLSVFPNQGGGILGAAISSASTTEDPFGLATADFNADGFNDVVVTSCDCSDTERVEMYYGKGDGTFQPVTYYPTGADPYWIDAGDFNGDGRPDFITSNSSTVTVWVNLP